MATAPSPGMVILPVCDAFLLRRRMETALKLFDAQSSRLYYHVYESAMNIRNADVESDIPYPERHYLVDAMTILLNHMWVGMPPSVVGVSLRHIADLVSQLELLYG
jgi:hypothetical protein